METQGTDLYSGTMWIQNGYLLDPATGTEGYFSVKVQDGLITGIYAADDAGSEMIPDYQNNCTVFDASGCYVMPGFIDLHVHLREPGFEDKETVATGTLSAAAGGFTTVCCMPNTRPVTDSAETLQVLNNRIQKDAKVHCLPIGAMTLGQEGKTPVDVNSLAELGCCALSEDGRSVAEPTLCREVMRRAKLANLPIFDHCEDKSVSGNGVIFAGEKARTLGFPGIPAGAEYRMVERELQLAEETGCQIHLCHISTEGSVNAIIKAKQRGGSITAETCPHYFVLCDMDIPEDNANYKMNPPLASKQDKEAIIKALQSGVIDCIATDHAPHTPEEKKASFLQAPFGIVGLETCFSLSYTHLVQEGILTPMQLVACLSANPAKILNSNRGQLTVGSPADITIADPKVQYTIDPQSFYSKGRNTPFAGQRVYGRIRATIVDGMVVYQSQHA